MSKKHEQRTRTEILARRAEPIVTTSCYLRNRVPVSPKPYSRSKYMPHIGAKEQERAKRLYESRFINERFVSVAQFMHPNLPAELCHERSAPTLCQMSKRQYEATLSTVTDEQWSEYESVF